MVRKTHQRTLDGKDIPCSTVDQERVRIRVCRRTQTEFHRMRMRGLTIVESADIASKLIRFALNNLNNEDIEILQATEDDNVIQETLSKLYLNN